MRIVAFIVLSVCAFGAEPAADAKPNQIVDRAMAPGLADANKAQDAYRAALMKVADRMTKDLERVKLDAMKKGDLGTANDADAMIKDLNAGKLADMVVANAKSQSDLLGDAPQASIVGKWIVKYDTGFISPLEIKEDGTAQSNQAYRWNIKNGTLTMVASTGTTDTYKLPVKDQMVGTSSICPTVTLTRVKHAIEADGKSLVGVWRIILPNGAIKCNMVISKNLVDVDGGGVAGTMADGVISYVNGTSWKLVNEDGKWIAILPGSEGRCKMVR